MNSAVLLLLLLLPLFAMRLKLLATRFDDDVFLPRSFAIHGRDHRPFPKRSLTRPAPHPHGGLSTVPPSSPLR